MGIRLRRMKGIDEMSRNSWTAAAGVLLSHVGQRETTKGDEGFGPFSSLVEDESRKGRSPRRSRPSIGWATGASVPRLRARRLALLR